MKRTLMVLSLCLALAASAQDTIGTHVVKAGETLQGITAKYLGTSKAWQENWKLNPDVRDPNKLVPGQKLRVIVARTLPAQSALIRRVSRHVERKPEPNPWISAQAGDKLAERHGVHTFAASSAELRFDDDTTLTLTEESLVFLRAASPAPTTRERSAIEIVDGHADLEKPAKTKKPIDIEIVVGSTVATPKDAAAKARFRSENRNAQVMSYRGATSVASAGAEVSVASGMGVSVPDGEKPPAPEKLLGAPKIAALDVAVPRPRLQWSALDGAKSYAVEVCRDTHCAEMIARATGIAATEWKPVDALPAGSLFWRVTARSASGLDGYPAAAPLVVRRGISGTIVTEGRGSEGTNVILYRGDMRVTATRAKSDGTFVFADLDSGDYTVAVDSHSISAAAWPDETHPTPGGLRADVDDDAGTLATSEHIAAVHVAESPVDGIDFTFSFGAVTNARDSGQGSLRQFIENANALPGPNAMQFLAKSATIKLATPLPRITDAITIAGRATEEEIGSVTRVGTNGTPLRNPSRSALTIDFGGAPVGIDATAELTLRDVMLTGAATHVRAASRLTIDDVVIGELLVHRDATGVEIGGDATLRRMLITGMSRSAIAVTNSGRLDGEHLEISDSGEGIRLISPGSRIRNSLLLLNAKGASPNGAFESCTFRGNRDDGVKEGGGNEFEALTASR